MVGKGAFVVWMTALYVGRTDTMSVGRETSKVSSKRKALMMLLLKLFLGLMIPASIACCPGNTSGRFAVAWALYLVSTQHQLLNCIYMIMSIAISLHFEHSTTVFSCW